MPSSEWPTPEAIEAAEAEYNAGQRMGFSRADSLCAALTAAAKASPVIPAPKCETCHGKPRYREGTIGPQTVGMEATGRVHICPDCHGTGVAEVIPLGGVAENAVSALLELLPIEGSWNDGYRVSPTVQPHVVALPEEWAEAAHAICELHAVLTAEPVAEVIPVAVLRDLRAWIAKSQALPALRSQDFEAGRQLAFKAVVGWLDEHTRKEPQPNERTT